MNERDLSQFLTDDERALIEADRRITIARTIASQANLLTIYGATDDHIRDNVGTMRVAFDQLPTERIIKIQKSIADHTLALAGMQPVPVAPTAISLERGVQEATETALPPLEAPEAQVVDQPVQMEPGDAMTGEAVSDNTVPVNSVGEAQDAGAHVEIDAIPTIEPTVAVAAPQDEPVREAAPDGASDTPQMELIQRTPGRATAAMKNLFSTTLTPEQCRELTYFDDEQIAAFTEAVSEVYAQNASKKRFVPLQVNRIRLVLQGAETHQVARHEGSKTTAVYQSLYASLPKFYEEYKQQILDAFHNARGVVASAGQAHYSTSTAPSVGEIHQPVRETVVGETEAYADEPLVALVKGVYNTNDPEALAGISDLFSTGRGIVTSTEQSIEAARYFRGLIQRSGISLSMSIDRPTARSAVERLLEGVGSGDERKWFTLSEILHETPEGLREDKQRGVTNALTKIIRQIDRPSLVKEDPREKQVEALRAELHTWIGVPQEITGQIIDRALEKEVEFTGELGKALLQMYQVAAGVGLDEKELNIMRLFVIPRPGSSPRSIAEIREVLKRDQNKNGISMKQLENGYVSSMLLRSFDKIVVQRRDG